MPIQRNRDHCLADSRWREPEREREPELARLDALLATRRWDHQLYCTAVTSLPAELTAAYSRLRPHGFARLLATLAWHTHEELPYELCDDLAAFYAKAFWGSPSLPQRRFALERMLALGVSHRRYIVADQVRQLLWQVHEKNDVALVVGVLERSPWTGWYAHHNTFRGPLDEAVATVLQRSRGTGAWPCTKAWQQRHKTQKHCHLETSMYGCEHRSRCRCAHLPAPFAG